MNVQKPIGGKSYMVCLGPIPEAEYKSDVKIAREKGMNVQDYYLWVKRRSQQCEEWRGT